MNHHKHHPRLAALVCVCITLSAAAPALSAPETILTLSSAASRGSYQAGVLYILLRRMRQCQHTPEAEHCKQVPADLAGISGVSQGAVNALLAALMWCSEQEQMPDDNLLWNAAKEISWGKLFPTMQSCEAYRDANPMLDAQCTGDDPYLPDDVLMSFNATRHVERSLKDMLTSSSAFRDGCEVPVALAHHASYPQDLSLGGQRVPTSRRIVAFEFVSRALAGKAPHAEFRALKGLVNTSTPLLQLPHASPSDPTRLSNETIFEALKASISVPLMSAPRRMLYCGRDCEAASAPGLHCPEGQSLCQEHLLDGDLFDGLPLSMSLEMARAKAARMRSRKNMMLETLKGLTLGVLRPPPSIVSEDEADPVDVSELPNRFLVVDPRPSYQSPSLRNTRGLPFFEDLIHNFTLVTNDYERQTLYRYEEDLKTRVDTVENHQPLVGNYLYGHASFLDDDFRLFDYVMGLFDGLMWLSRPSADVPWDTVAEHFLAHAGEVKLDRNRLPEMTDLLCETFKRHCASGCKGEVADEVTKRLCFEGAEPSGEGPTDVLMGTIFASVKRLDYKDNQGPIQAFKAFADQLKANQPSLDLPFTRDPVFWAYAASGGMIGRLEVVNERHSDSDTIPLALGLGQYALAVATNRNAEATVFFPSTAEQWWARYVIPAHIAGDIYNGGLRLGWELARVQPFDGWSLPTVRLTAHWFRHHTDLSERFGFSLPVGASYAFSPAKFEPGLRLVPWWTPARIGDDFGGLSVGAEVFVQTIFGRLEFSAGVRNLNHFTEDDFEDTLYIAVGANDLLGLILHLL